MTEKPKWIKINENSIVRHESIELLEIEGYADLDANYWKWEIKGRLSSGRYFNYKNNLFTKKEAQEYLDKLLEVLNNEQ